MIKCVEGNYGSVKFFPPLTTRQPPQQSWLGSARAGFFFFQETGTGGKPNLDPYQNGFFFEETQRVDSTALLAEQLSNAKEARLRIEGPSSRAHVSWHCIDMVLATQAWWTLLKSDLHHMLNNGQALRMYAISSFQLSQKNEDHGQSINDNDSYWIT